MAFRVGMGDVGQSDRRTTRARDPGCSRKIASMNMRCVCGAGECKERNTGVVGGGEMQGSEIRRQLGIQVKGRAESVIDVCGSVVQRGCGGRGGRLGTAGTAGGSRRGSSMPPWMGSCPGRGAELQPARLRQQTRHSRPQKPAALPGPFPSQMQGLNQDTNAFGTRQCACQHHTPRAIRAHAALNSQCTGRHSEINRCGGGGGTGTHTYTEKVLQCRHRRCTHTG